MPDPAPPPQEYARIAVILILLFFLYTSPDNGPPPGFASPHDYGSERIERSRASLDVLNSSRWQDFSPRSSSREAGETARYLNLTGFRESDGYAWERLGAWKERSATFLQEAVGTWRGRETSNVVYRNVTGIVSGNWVRYTDDLKGNETRKELNLTEISPGIEWSFRGQEYWTRNITGPEGKMMMRVDEKDVEEISAEGLEGGANDTVREVAATLTIQDESSSGDGWEMRVHGVHWPKHGLLLMTTTSDKFAGIFGLPHLTAGVDLSGLDQFRTSQKLLNRTLEATVENMEKAAWSDPTNPWSSSPENQGDAIMPVPHCEYVVFAQVYPIKLENAGSDIEYAEKIISQIEQELRYPNGAPIPKIPRLQISSVIFSPDCGFILESKGPPTFVPSDGEHLVGLKQELFLHGFQSWLHIHALVIFGQTLLHKMQSKEASTPSTIGRVSFYTVIMMLIADSLLFFVLSLLSGVAPNLFPAALLASFSAFMSMALNMRFIAAIWNVQEPERRAALQAQQAAEAAASTSRANSTPAPVPIITAAGADIPAQPATTPALPSLPTNDTPIIIPSDQDVDAEIAENTANAAAPLLPTANGPATTANRTQNVNSFGATYVRFFGTTIMIAIISISSISWPPTIRSAWINLLSFTYLSFWIPQIRRNITRNCRKALLWKFVVGQSVLRLLPFAYFYLKEDNLIFAETDPVSFCVLAGWLWVQIWILVAQEILGPRWGLPKTWYDEGWDYHPILREDNVEDGGLPIGLVQIPASPTLDRSNTSESERKRKDNSVRSVDCAICMQALEVPVVAAGEGESAGGVAGMLERRKYMVTPCRHVFHSTCLEGWMRFRLQCPICREGLPPL